jgi:hypothetical protein
VFDGHKIIRVKQAAIQNIFHHLWICVLDGYKALLGASFMQTEQGDVRTIQ